MKIAALIVVGIAAICDLKTRKIPNKLTFPASGIGILMQAIYFASWSKQSDLLMQFGAGALTGIMGWIAGVLIMSVTKLFLRQFGHGDTKLMAALGTFLGPWFILLVYFYYSLAFGFFSMVKLVSVIPWGQLWLSGEMKKAGVEPLEVKMDKVTEARKELIPVAPFIAAGTLLAILFEKPTLAFLGFK